MAFSAEYQIIFYMIGNIIIYMIFNYGKSIIETNNGEI